MTKIRKFTFGENDITFSSEGVLPQVSVLINSTQLDLQNKTDLRQKYFLSKKLGLVEDTKQNYHFPLRILIILINFDQFVFKKFIFSIF